MRSADESRHFSVGKGGLMLDRLNLAARRQELVKVTAPARGIVARAEASHRRPIQHAFDATAQARCRLRFGRPQRLDDLDDERRVDR
jgi:hypothetical protein